MRGLADMTVVAEIVKDDESAAVLPARAFSIFMPLAWQKITK
jgi:hypothetical protein